MDRLAGVLDPATQTLGAVAHSVRAVGVAELEALHQEADRRLLVFHMHLEEQPAEIEECLRAHGSTPAALLRARLRLNPAFTAVHCTHTAEADLDELIEAGASICLCPLTEANLGDGFANVPRMLRRGGRLCLGTDSNSRISMLEEMRLLEYGQRLAAQRLGVCRDEEGHVAPALWRAATVNGARALGLQAGRIRTGDLADLVAIDLGAPCLAGWSPETLLASLVFGAGEDAVAGVCVGGRWTPGIGGAGPARAAPGPEPAAPPA
jgi:formiminoglutamate deiminase